MWNGLTKSKDSGNDKEFTGNLIELLDTAEHFIKVNTERRWRKRPHDRIDYPDYPERAVTEALVNAFVHRDYTMYGSEVHIDIFPDRLEVVSPGGMPDGSLVQELDLRSVASDRRNPILADMFAQMDYMERKGSGFGMILDAYEREVPNPRGLKPQFFSCSGSFRVVFPNLNYDTRDAAINVPINAPINVPIKERVLELIRNAAGINRARMSEVLSVDVKTIGRALKELEGVVEHRGSKKTGGYYVTEGKKIVESEL